MPSEVLLGHGLFIITKQKRQKGAVCISPTNRAREVNTKRKSFSDVSGSTKPKDLWDFK